MECNPAKCKMAYIHIDGYYEDFGEAVYLGLCPKEKAKDLEFDIMFQEGRLLNMRCLPFCDSTQAKMITYLEEKISILKEELQDLLKSEDIWKK